ncbi:MAG TPA: preprotein translocase subunit SecG [Candidatus Acidoferrum sp.]|nr:preprotein translocase subunit SecG [Candidatus Acidoferrum sp.]
MSTLQMVIATLELIAAVALVAIVMMQESKESGMGVITGGSDTFFGKSGGNPRDAMLHKATVGLGSLFVVLALATVFVVK